MNTGRASLIGPLFKPPRRAYNSFKINPTTTESFQRYSLSPQVQNSVVHTWWSAVSPSTFWKLMSVPFANNFFTSSTSPLETAERNTIPALNLILAFFLDRSTGCLSVSLPFHLFKDSWRFCRALPALEVPSAIFPWRYGSSSAPAAWDSRTDHVTRGRRASNQSTRRGDLSIPILWKPWRHASTKMMFWLVSMVIFFLFSFFS